MKQIIRLGASYVLSPVKRYIGYVLLITIYTFLFPGNFVQAQTTNIKNLGIPEGGLKIGDSIPEALWHLPLQVMNHPEGKDTITLNDYRGKLIILDFWGTFCSACISAMPAIHEVLKPFSMDVIVLPISWSRPEETMQSLKNNETLKSLNMQSVVDAKPMIDAFPHTVVPHYVWISPTGKVAATTTADDVSPDNISKVLRGEDPIYALKTFMDPERPLFFSEDIMPKDARLLGYSLFVTGEIPSLGSGTRIRTLDGEPIGMAIFNTGLLQMFTTIAWQMRGKNPENRMVSLVTIPRDTIATFDFILCNGDNSGLYERLLEFLYQNTGFRGRWVTRGDNEYFEISK